VSRSTKGAISELLVAGDLLFKGYEVFRAVSPACSCDLIAQKNGRLTRIEVRTGALNKNGSVCFPKKSRDIDHHDHFSVFNRLRWCFSALVWRFTLLSDLLTRAARISSGVRDIGAGDADSQGVRARSCFVRVPAGRRTRTVDRHRLQDRVVDLKRKRVRAAKCAADCGADRYGTLDGGTSFRICNLHGGLHDNR